MNKYNSGEYNVLTCFVKYRRYLLLQFVTVVLPQFRYLLESTTGNDRSDVIENLGVIKVVANMGNRYNFWTDAQ